MVSTFLLGELFEYDERNTMVMTNVAILIFFSLNFEMFSQ